MLNRRHFLQSAGIVSASLALTACSQETATVTPSIETETVNSPSPVPPTAVEITAAPRPTQHITPAAKQPFKLVHWDNWGEDNPWLRAEIENFQIAYPWIRIERKHQGDIDAALRSADAAGIMPDIYFGGPLPIEQHHSKNWLCAPISDFADFPDFRKLFPNPQIDFAEGSNVIEGQTYTAPRQARSGWGSQIFVNLSLLETYGVDDLPDSEQALIDVAEAVSRGSSGGSYGYAFAFANAELAGLFEWLGARSYKVGGGDWRNGHSQYSQNPAFQIVLESLNTLTRQGYILPESYYTVDQVELLQLFAEGRVAMIQAQIMDAVWLKQNYPDFQNYTVLPPLAMDGQRTHALYAPPGISGVPGYIAAKSIRPEESWLWFKWLHLPECGKRWVQAGLGYSIFPENNSPEYFEGQVWQDYLTWNAGLTRIEPLPESRNLNCSQVKAEPIEQDFTKLTQMTYDYWLLRDDIPTALAELAATQDINWENALSEAQRSGLDVSAEDFIFPDWDPLSDYLPEE